MGVQTALIQIFGRESHYVEAFEAISWTPGVIYHGTTRREWDRAFASGLEQAVGILASGISDAETYDPAARTNPRSNATGDSDTGFPSVVTLPWLFHNAPVSFWWTASGLLLATFVLGARLGQVPFIAEVIGTPVTTQPKFERSSETQQVTKESLPEIVVTANDIKLKAGESTGQGVPATADADISVVHGSLVLLREAEITHFDFDRQDVVTEGVTPAPRLISVDISTPIVKADRPSDRVTLQFDLSTVIPRGIVAGSLSEGAKVRLGTISTRLHYKANGVKQSVICDFPVFLTR